MAVFAGDFWAGAENNVADARGVKTDGVKVGGAKNGVLVVGGASVKGFNCSGAN